MLEQRSTFDWQGLVIEVRVSTPVYLSSFRSIYGHDMVNLEIEAAAREPLPITETGYVSRFTRPDLIDADGGPAAYARAWLDYEAALPHWQAHLVAARQYSLFE